MYKKRLLIIITALPMLVFAQQLTLVNNIASRQKISLNGQWEILVDPYENGFYDYRLKESDNGFFKNAKPKTKQDFVEYNFVATDYLNVPGDWNSQREKLQLYEGTIWYKKSSDYAVQLKLADELGLMVWSEIPVYWTVHYWDTAVLNKAKSQLEASITQNKNRASVIIWSMANETPISDERNKFLSSLCSFTRSLDDTRLLSAALEMREGRDKNTFLLDDPLGQYLDVLGCNEYLGWYSGKPEDCLTKKWETPYKKPLVISEFGGEALFGRHGDKTEIWNEENQASLYVYQLQMLSKIPFLRGMSPWILADFRSPRRQLHGIQDGWNRKGLISDKGLKKMAWYTLTIITKPSRNKNCKPTMERRHFLQQAGLAGAGLLLSAALNKALATGKKNLVLMIISGWQDTNIGDIAHTFGLITLLKEYIPSAKLVVWKKGESAQVDALLLKNFPGLEIIHGKFDSQLAPITDDLKTAFQKVDFFIHGSGPSVVATDHLRCWVKNTGKPFGIFGVTIQTIDAPLKELLGKATFIYTRETASIDVLKKEGFATKNIAFAPDATFHLTIHNKEKATAFLAANKLEHKKFICVIPRLRKTPYYKIYGKEGWTDAAIAEVEKVNNASKEKDHAKLREVMVAWVRKTGNKVLVCPEMTYQVDIMDELLIDPLPADVKPFIVKRGYWLTDEAASVYAHAHTVISIECHSPIISYVNNTPAFYIRQPTDSIKGQMYYDLGFNKWVFEIDETTGLQIADRLMEVHSDYGLALKELKRSMGLVKKRYDEDFKHVKSYIGT